MTDHPRRHHSTLLLRAALTLCCLLAMLPAMASYELLEGVEYLPGAAPEEACAWEAALGQTAIAKSRNFIAKAAAPAPSSAGTALLSLQVVRLTMSRGSRKNEYAAVIRANVVEGGKLIATRDFSDDASFDNRGPGCDTLRRLGAALGEEVATWVAGSRFIKCGAGCDGIHPDEPIVVGTEVLIGNDDAINETVRVDCRFTTSLVVLLVKAFNDDNPPPRARLEARPIDVRLHPGRRLVLRVDNVHALGGGGITGPKWMDMAGELWDGKTLVGSFESHTSSGRGLTTCRSVESLSESSADMIAKWLRSPSLGAKLD